MKQVFPALVLLFLMPLLAVVEFPSAHAKPREAPLPVGKSKVLKDRKVIYVVDGRVTIRAGVEITLQKGVRVRGTNGAVLEVIGAFVAHGIDGTEVMISGVKIVLGPKTQRLHVDLCTLSSPIVTEKGQSTAGMITIENCKLEGSPGVDVAMHAGKFKVMSCQSGDVLRMRGVDRGGKRNSVYASIRTSSLRGGVDIQNIADLTVRGNTLGGGTVLLRDNKKLAFDSNKVTAGSLVFEQAEAGRFGRTKIGKCDIYSQTLRIFAPVGTKKRESVTIQKCYFDGALLPKQLAAIVSDRADDPKNAVKVIVKKPMKRALNLAKEWN